MKKNHVEMYEQMSLRNMSRTQVSVQAIEVCKNKCVSCQAITRQRTGNNVQMYVGQQFERQLVQVCMYRQQLSGQYVKCVWVSASHGRAK